MDIKYAALQKFVHRFEPLSDRVVQLIAIQQWPGNLAGSIDTIKELATG
jgi:hypothetical protein